MRSDKNTVEIHCRRPCWCVEVVDQRQELWQRELEAGTEKTADKAIRGRPTYSRARLEGVKFPVKMVNGNDEKIGREEYNGIAAQKEVREVGKSFKGRCKSCNGHRIGVVERKQR